MSTLDSFLNHPIETLEKALHIRKQIAALEDGLKKIFGAPSASAAQRARWARWAKWAKRKRPEPTVSASIAATVPKTKKKGGMSAAGRARIVAAQKARWATVKAGNPTPAKAAGKKKRKLSPEARAKIVAAVKARWARVKSGKA